MDRLGDAVYFQLKLGVLLLGRFLASSLFVLLLVAVFFLAVVFYVDRDHVVCGFLVFRLVQTREHLVYRVDVLLSVVLLFFRLGV